MPCTVLELLSSALNLAFFIQSARCEPLQGWDFNFCGSPVRIVRLATVLLANIRDGETIAIEIAIVNRATQVRR